MEPENGLDRSATTRQMLRRAIARGLRMKTRVGFVGAGGIANRHIGNLLAFDDVAVLAVADPQLDRAEAAAARVGGRAYDRHDEPSLYPGVQYAEPARARRQYRPSR